ncbi:histamine H3 receptor isoform 2-T3 [Hipposideros larvatus]
MERAPPDGPLNASGALAGEAAAGGARGFSAAWTALLAALMALLIVTTVMGNALVMLAFVADSSLRTQNNFFLLNLAVSDFLVGAFCIPLYVPYVLTGRWPFGRGLCKLWLVMDYLLCTSSVFNIVLISYDRFLSVTRAVSYRAQQGDTRQAVRKMVLVWVLAFLLYGPAILSWEYLSGGSSIPEGHCYAEFFYNWYFLITASTLEFFTPFLSVTFFNLSIYLNIQRRTRDRLDGAREAASLEAPPGAQGSPPAAPGCWGCWQKRRGEAVPLHRDCYSQAPWAPRPVGDAGQQQRRLHHCRRRSCSSRHLERQSRLPAAVLHFHFSSAPRKLQNPWLAPLLARSVCSTGTPLVRAGPSSWAPSLVTRGTGRPGLPLRKVVAGTVHTTVCGVWSSGKLHG